MRVPVCPKRPREAYSAYSRSALRMRSDLATSAAPGDVICRSSQPSSGVPDLSQLCKESSSQVLISVFSMTRVHVPNRATHHLTAFVAAADSHGEAYGSAMFKLRERDGLHEPHRCHSAEDRHIIFTSAATAPNSKETFAKFVARTHRERSAQHDTIKVPRHRSAARFHICRA